jgi:hypothetical protein
MSVLIVRSTVYFCCLPWGLNYAELLFLYSLTLNVSNMNVLVKEVKELTPCTGISLNLGSEMSVCVD